MVKSLDPDHFQLKDHNCRQEVYPKITTTNNSINEIAMIVKFQTENENIVMAIPFGHKKQIIRK